MAIIKPFKGITPTAENVAQVVTRPFDFYSKEQRSVILDENPNSFLHVIVPEHRSDIKSEPNSPDLFRKSKARFQTFIDKHILVQDSIESFYVYTQVINGTSHTGIIGCASVEDYKNNVIRKHEHTITEREETLKNYLRVCDINAEPVCMTYRPSPVVAELTDEITTRKPDFNFITADTIRHKLWKINDAREVEKITAAFAVIPAIYIADGHHRCSSSALLAEEMKAENPNHTGKEAYNYFMAIYFPDNELKICEFNRIVKDLNGLNSERFTEKLSENFKVKATGSEEVRPTQAKHFGMYMEQKWYSLELRNKTLNESHPVKSLDVSILTELILTPVLGIQDQRTDKRIGFVSGTKGVEELVRKVDSGAWKVAFTLYPVQGAEFYRIADGGYFMPPKSTYIEPKLRSGLVVYALEL